MSINESRKELLGIIKDVESYVKLERKSGVEYIAAPKKSKAGLSEVKKEVFSCKACPLHKTKTNYVFSDGSETAKLMFVGEAPGADEDLQGVPFVGRAGQLLTKMIEAMGLKRQEVYICNVLKCRPPENRSPLPEEVKACKGYLVSQIDIVSPKVICCLGKHAAQALLDTDVPITKVRGREMEFNGKLMIPTYHPAYLLRNPPAKKEVWEDLKKIMKILSED
ncbi:MAG: uracil-DNA glycosylase [Candidatus Omnitrophota bacterium]|jgi:DNA polymerase